MFLNVDLKLKKSKWALTHVPKILEKALATRKLAGRYILDTGEDGKVYLSAEVLVSMKEGWRELDLNESKNNLQSSVESQIAKLLPSYSFTVEPNSYTLRGAFNPHWGTSNRLTVETGKPPAMSSEMQLVCPRLSNLLWKSDTGQNISVLPAEVCQSKVMEIFDVNGCSPRELLYLEEQIVKNGTMLIGASLPDGLIVANYTSFPIVGRRKDEIPKGCAYITHLVSARTAILVPPSAVDSWRNLNNVWATAEIEHNKVSGLPYETMEQDSKLIDMLDKWGLGPTNVGLKNPCKEIPYKESGHVWAPYIPQVVTKSMLPPDLDPVSLSFVPPSVATGLDTENPKDPKPESIAIFDPDITTYKPILPNPKSTSPGVEVLTGQSKKKIFLPTMYEENADLYHVWSPTGVRVESKIENCCSQPGEFLSSFRVLVDWAGERFAYYDQHMFLVGTFHKKLFTLHSPSSATSGRYSLPPSMLLSEQPLGAKDAYKVKYGEAQNFYPKSDMNPWWARVVVYKHNPEAFKRVLSAAKFFVAPKVRDLEVRYVGNKKIDAFPQNEVWPISDFRSPSKSLYSYLTDAKQSRYHMVRELAAKRYDALSALPPTPFSKEVTTIMKKLLEDIELIGDLTLGD